MTEKVKVTEEVEVEVEAKVKAKVPGVILDTGEEGSRSAYIRQEFLKDRSRAEIAKELDTPYYIVYSATANMFNAVHTEEGGRASGGVRGVMVEDPETGEQITRAEAMRKMFAAGKNRTEIKEYFDTPYATVYAATKDVEAPEGAVKGGRVMVEDTENPGVQVPRTELIRRLYKKGEGMTRREIADALKCDYAVVWASTKEPKKAEAEAEAVAEAVAVAEGDEVIVEAVAEDDEELGFDEGTDNFVDVE